MDCLTLKHKYCLFFSHLEIIHLRSCLLSSFLKFCSFTFFFNFIRKHYMLIMTSKKPKMQKKKHPWYVRPTWPQLLPCWERPGSRTARAGSRSRPRGPGPAGLPRHGPVRPAPAAEAASPGQGAGTELRCFGGQQTGSWAAACKAPTSGLGTQ